jgi:Family of unknown function (DUF6941)
MRLDFFMLADAAHVADGKLYVHGGGITRVNLPETPFHLPQVAAVARFVIEQGDIGNPSVVAIEWRQPDGEPLPPRIEGEVVPTRPDGAVEEEELAAILVATFNGLSLPQVGNYEVVLMLAGNTVARRPVLAVRTDLRRA